MHLHVGGAGELHGELMDPVAGPDRVGVPVHQSWGHQPHTSSAEHKIKKNPVTFFTCVHQQPWALMSVS